MQQPSVQRDRHEADLADMRLAARTKARRELAEQH